jgi:hypothetical protein
LLLESRFFGREFLPRLVQHQGNFSVRGESVPALACRNANITFL